MRSLEADWPVRRATGALIGGPGRNAPSAAGPRHVGRTPRWERAPAGPSVPRGAAEGAAGRGEGRAPACQ